MNRPTKIILHCSASPDHKDIGAKEIKAWHIERGWSDIGYHFIIRRNGTVEIGRKETQIGAHAKGFNKNSIGICLIGELRYTNFQMRSMVNLLGSLMEKHNIKPTDLLCHNEVTDNKTCPNFSGPMLRMLMTLYLRQSV